MALKPCCYFAAVWDWLYKTGQSWLSGYLAVIFYWSSNEIKFAMCLNVLRGRVHLVDKVHATVAINPMLVIIPQPTTVKIMG